MQRERQLREVSDHCIHTAKRVERGRPREARGGLRGAGGDRPLAQPGTGRLLVCDTLDPAILSPEKGSCTLNSPQLIANILSSCLGLTSIIRTIRYAVSEINGSDSPISGNVLCLQYHLNPPKKRRNQKSHQQLAKRAVGTDGYTHTHTHTHTPRTCATSPPLPLPAQPQADLSLAPYFEAVPNLAPQLRSHMANALLNTLLRSV